MNLQGVFLSLGLVVITLLIVLIALTWPGASATSIPVSIDMSSGRFSVLNESVGGGEYGFTGGGSLSIDVGQGRYLVLVRHNLEGTSHIVSIHTQNGELIEGPALEEAEVFGVQYDNGSGKLFGITSDLNQFISIN